MMEVLQFFESDRGQALWPWIAALDAFDYCDPRPLATLLRDRPVVPGEVKLALADIVEGRRKPNKRAAAKLKLEAAERMKIARELAISVGQLGMVAKGRFLFVDEQGESRKATDVIGDLGRCETIDAKRAIERLSREVVAQESARRGISAETAENLLRDLRAKLGIPLAV